MRVLQYMADDLNKTPTKQQQQATEVFTSSSSEDDDAARKPSTTTAAQQKIDNRIQISSQYYQISMTELRSYENFLKVFVLAALKRVGVCVIEDFLPEQMADLIKEEIEGMYGEDSSVGTSEAKETCVGLEKYRGDEVKWIGKSDAQHNVKKLNSVFHQLIGAMAKLPELNDSKFKITHKSHAQISRFRSGQIGYKPHIENPNNNGRLLSVGYYTNKEYSKIENSGLVRFYLKNNTRQVCVEPKFNTAVIYWSDRRVIKEVLPSNSIDLYHITSWFFGSCRNDFQTRTVVLPTAENG